MEKFFRHAFGWLFSNYGEGLWNPLKAVEGVWNNLFGQMANNGEGGLFTELFGGRGTNFGNFIDAVTNRVTAEHMTGADREAADLNYKMQEQFFNDYQSIPAQVQQSVEAGLNPALMYGKGATPMSPVAGTAQASQPSIDPGQLLSLMANIGFRSKEISIEKQLKGSQANYYNALAKSYENENSVFAERYEFWKQLQTKNLANIDADTFIKQCEPYLIRQNVRESEARSTLLKYQSDSAKVEADFAERNWQSLLDLRKSAQELNKANADYARSGSSESKQRLTELQQSWGTRWRTLQESLRKMSAEAGMTEKEAEAFWSDKRLNELLVLSEIFDNYKGELRIFGNGGTVQNSFERGMTERGGSMYPPAPFFPSF